MITVNEKYCETCQENKPFLGFTGQFCKECAIERSYFFRVRRRYGLTANEYNALFDEQEGCCAICGKHQSEFERRLCVDHNHNTGEVRGLLCFKCNMAMGVLDNIDFAEVKKYLKMD